MVEAAAGVFTVGVFQDVAWATKGLDALRRAGFASESLTVMAKDGTDASALIERTLGSAGGRIRGGGLGPLGGGGPLWAGAVHSSRCSKALRAISKSWEWPVRCAASAFRRMTRGFSKPSPAEAA